ncbi:extensin family protein [Mesorhizobium sp. SB112]|uniref:extensin-like domain-containing protein n=1 Tax=Mesorhizobium sp. SB112 TaxID=3151853 RepID=UPI003264C193
MTIWVPLLLAASSLASFAQTNPLPQSAPVPTENPAPDLPAGEDTQSKTPPEEAPVPAEKPADMQAKPATEDTQAETPPLKAPVPEEKPADKQAEPELKKPPLIVEPALPQKPPLPEKSPEDDKKAETKPEDEGPKPLSADDMACRKRLTELGVEFEERPRLSDPAGCSVPHPVAIKSLGKTISLEPEAVVNCAMAEASARFAQDVISPAAKADYGEELKSISQASGYVCRPRNGTTKLSEHAFGNALDIARFTLTKGTEIDVEPAPDDKAQKFLMKLRKAACGPFKTVLGPGSDADHSLHFHFDLAQRRNGGTFCQ